MTVYLLGFQEAKNMEGYFDYSISINDAKPEPSFRVFGNKATLLLNFNDVWLDDKGRKTIWSGSSAIPIFGPDPLTDASILDKIDTFHKDNPNLLNEKTLIHCWAGVSRSSSVYLYLMMRDGKTFDDALNEILSVRPFARPNLILAKEMEKRFGDDTIVSKLQARLNYNSLF